MSAFLLKLQALNPRFCWKTNSTVSIFQLVAVRFKNTCIIENFREKSNSFEMESVCVTDQRWIFMK